MGHPHGGGVSMEVRKVGHPPTLICFPPTQAELEWGTLISAHPFPPTQAELGWGTLIVGE